MDWNKLKKEKKNMKILRSYKVILLKTMNPSKDGEKRLTKLLKKLL